MPYNWKPGDPLKYDEAINLECTDLKYRQILANKISRMIIDKEILLLNYIKNDSEELRYLLSPK